MSVFDARPLVFDQDAQVDTTAIDAQARDRLRVWLTWTVLAIAAGAFAFTMLHQYNHVQHSLRMERAALQSANVEVQTARRTLASVQARTVKARVTTTAVKRQTAQAVSQRGAYDRTTASLTHSLKGVNQHLDQTQIALYSVATNANQVSHCLDGIANASTADARGNVSIAVASLNDASSDCAKTSALASGAVSPYDFPDPSVLYAGGAYYAYSTNSGAGDIQVLRSTDMVNWHFAGNGLAQIPNWAAKHATWAPSVLQRWGYVVAYYTIPDVNRGRRCISRAVSASPAGPFVDTSTGPLVCDTPMAGAIDASPFVDPATGKPYLVWKAETNPGAIWVQQLSDDGLSLVGQPAQVLGVDRAFERGVVEGPAMVAADGRYFLIYSAGDWSSAGYTTAYATCAGPLGPCTKPADNRILSSGSHLLGPGGTEPFRAADGSLWVAFHAYAPGAVGYPNSRYLHLARLRVVNGRPVVDAQP